MDKIRRMIAGLLFLLSASATLGSTFTVTNTNDSGAGSLREAVANAANGDTVNFSLAFPATIALSTPITFGPSVTISGPGSSSLVISGGDSVVAFIVNVGATVSISGVSIEHGSSLLGGGIFNAGTLTLDSVTVSNCTLGNQLGGGIFNSGTLNVNNSHVDGNIAGTNGSPGVVAEGGGIYNYSGSLTLTNSDVSNNQALGGSASNTDAGTSLGGGIFVNSGTLIVNGSSINGNFGGQGGGIVNLGTLTITNSTVSGNSSYRGGNGIATVNKATITGSAISGNQTIPSQNQYGVQSENDGGGIFSGGTLTVTNSTIWGNSVIVGNIAGHSGIGNSGGIFGVGEVNLAFVTIANNTGGIFVDFSAFGRSVLTTKSSILASNQTNGTDILNCSIASGASGVSDGFNISDDASCSGFFTQTGDLNSTPAGLDPNGLQNYGGPTKTVALSATSPAIDAVPVSSCSDVSGNPVTTDQRGVPRPQGPACDIGAFERFKSRFQIQAVEVYIIMDAVESLPLPLPRGIQTGLIAPLQAAVSSLNDGNVAAAIGQLGGFIGEVSGLQSDHVLTSQQASSLIAPAQGIIQSLR